MQNAENTPSKLGFLFKLLPTMHEVDTVDEIYRLLISIVNGGGVLGFHRAMLFVVDSDANEIRGRYGADQEPNHGDRRVSFEDAAREVFDLYEGLNDGDLTLNCRLFSVPLDEEASGLARAVRAEHAVLAEKQSSEFSDDPFFSFFNTRSYVAVPLKFGGEVAAVLSADRGSSQPVGSMDEISILSSLAKQAATIAQSILWNADARRRFRILNKMQETLDNADVGARFDDGIKAAMGLLTRAMGATGCYLRDLTRQKTIHIKPVVEYSPDREKNELAINESFGEILDRAAGRMESMWGDGQHPLVTPEAARTLQFFYAQPLVCGTDVAGSMAVYTEGTKHIGKTGYRSEDKALLAMCASLIAAKLEVKNKSERIDRIEDLIQELTSNLARERERARLGDRGLEFHRRVTDEVERVRATLAKRTPYAKRFSAASELVTSLQERCENYRQQLTKYDGSYVLADFFDLVRRTMTDFRAHAQNKQIKLMVCIPDKGPSLLVDKKRIMTALKSILDITHSALNDGDKMLVECTTSDERVHICVADTGRGLPGDTISRLFMPFLLAEEKDERKRALSVAGEILQKHSGEMTIKSSLTWKTILVLSFPMAANRDRRKARRDRRGGDERRIPVNSS